MYPIPTTCPLQRDDLYDWLMRRRNSIRNIICTSSHTILLVIISTCVTSFSGVWNYVKCNDNSQTLIAIQILMAVDRQALTGRQTDRHTNTNRQTDGQTRRLVDKQTQSNTHRQTDRNRMMDRQTHRQVDKQTQTDTDRQIKFELKVSVNMHASSYSNN